MLDKEKLRKADIFSGAAISLLGLWIISQGLKMPMKDSYGGVMNVWYVSPALFPLLVGGMITILGIGLVHTAFKSVGAAELGRVVRWLTSRELGGFLRTDAVVRFYAMVVLLFSYVFVQIPRIDFFLCSVLFLLAFICMFHFDDDRLLRRLLWFYFAGSLALAAFFLFGLDKALEGSLERAGDWLVLVFIAAFYIFTRLQIRQRPELRGKFRTGLILAVAAPFIVGPIFKYLLLVPMPNEGLVVNVMDAIWYWDF